MRREAGVGLNICTNYIHYNMVAGAIDYWLIEYEYAARDPHFKSYHTVCMMNPVGLVLRLKS